MYLVRNIKVSVKVKALILNNALTHLQDNNIVLKNFGNFISFKANNYTFILFKKGQNTDTHINITQIPTFSDINYALNCIVTLIKCEIISYTIDNIIATSDLGKFISLPKIVEERKFKQLKYNSEIFPGLFIKFKKGTIIIFHSGKTVIVGCKNIESIRWILRMIHANI